MEGQDGEGGAFFYHNAGAMRLFEDEHDMLLGAMRLSVTRWLSVAEASGATIRWVSGAEPRGALHLSLFSNQLG